VSNYDLKPGGKYVARANADMLKFGLPEIMIDGEVLEARPPNKLVQTYRFLFNDEHRKEGFSKITFEIADTGQGFCRLTVTHDVTNMPMMAAATVSKFSTDGGGGWNWILSDMADAAALRRERAPRSSAPPARARARTICEPRIVTSGRRTTDTLSSIPGFP
jgi:uncharacterized protein YndB with AHSA1/START domain